MSDAATAGRTALTQGIRRVEASLNRVLAALAVLLFATSTALAFASVVMRYAFGSSYAIVEELCRFTIVYAVLLYFGPLITRNAHLRMTILTDALKGRAARVTDTLMTAVMLLLIGALFYASIRWEMGLVSMGVTTMSGEMKAWVPSAALPVGLALGVIYTLFRLVYVLTDDLPDTLGAAA
ncbi:MAG: TRAP transporter small permease [Pseudooceanicola sp.]|nr:TRAP transporter small permease [Pseudooceanicola sp.]